jgi:AraC family transcriptional regulator
MSFAPAHTEGQAWHRNYNLDRLFLLIDPGFLQSYEFTIDPLDIPPVTNGHDLLIQGVLWSLAREMQNRAAEVPSVYAEHAAGLLMAHLIRSVRRGRSRQVRGAELSDASLRRVIEFIEDNLGGDVSLTALAALTGTGVDVFARNFKASVGLPPYRYVLQRRLRRAQALLTDSRKPIAEIAGEVGFSGQAHFTAQFGKVMGMSPASYRSRHRG